jgi:hypothetical protein
MTKEFKSQLGNVKITEKGLKLEEGSVHPCIKIRINDEWHYLFFQVNDEVKKCWTRLRYQWQAYLQNKSAEFVRK